MITSTTAIRTLPQWKPFSETSMSPCSRCRPSSNCPESIATGSCTWRSSRNGRTWSSEHILMSCTRSCYWRFDHYLPLVLVKYLYTFLFTWPAKSDALVRLMKMFICTFWAHARPKQLHPGALNVPQDKETSSACLFCLTDCPRPKNNLFTVI